LTTYTGDVQGAMKVGAQAYLLKSQLDKELLKTIRAVHAGNNPMGVSISGGKRVRRKAFDLVMRLESACRIVW
jgi:DNA-binding NarL/FixJ family response regulator